MKKLIVLSVVFALVASAAFAVDLGGTVIGNTTLAQSDTGDDAEVTGAGNIGRYRIDGGGEAGEGKFGGYFRLDGNGLNGNAWWKPIDQFKLLIGGNGGDGFIGKEGVTGWGFYQTPYDTDVVIGGNVWGWGPWYGIDTGKVDKDGEAIMVGNAGTQNMYGQSIIFRDVFFGGDGGNDLYLFISPMDILGINVILPFFSSIDTSKGYEIPAKVEDIFKLAIAQIDLKLDFGNIAITYRGGGLEKANGNIEEPGKIYLYYGGSFGDLSIDFGFSYQLAAKINDESVAMPMGVGLGLKYATDSFGIKLRVAATLAGDDKYTRILADLQPYFSLGDNLSAFISVGIGMTQPEEGDSVLGWHFNPYIQVGEEWGAKFLAGVKVWSAGELYGSDAITNWAIPIAIIVSF
jgi:hypothetical protein